MSEKQNIAVLVHKIAHELLMHGVSITYFQTRNGAENALRIVQRNKYLFNELASYIPVKNYELRKCTTTLTPSLIYVPKELK